MVLGYNCYFAYVVSRVRGPVDNLFCCDTDDIFERYAKLKT